MRQKTLADEIDELRIRRIREELTKSQGNGAQAAIVLGVTRANMSRWIKVYNLLGWQQQLKYSRKELLLSTTQGAT